MHQHNIQLAIKVDRSDRGTGPTRIEPNSFDVTGVEEQVYLYPHGYRREIKWSDVDGQADTLVLMILQDTDSTVA